MMSKANKELLKRTVEMPAIPQDRYSDLELALLNILDEQPQDKVATPEAISYSLDGLDVE